MLSAMPSPMMTNNFAMAGMQGPGAGASPVIQELEGLLEQLIDSTQFGPCEGPGGPGGASPVNFGAWNNQAQNPMQANQGLGGGWNSLAGSQPQVSIGGSPAPTGVGGEGGAAPAPNNTTNTNGAPGAGGTTIVNINAKKIKNSNIIVNGQNVTANSGKKAEVNGAAGQPQ